MIGASPEIPNRGAPRMSRAVSLVAESLSARGELQRAELLLGPALVEAVQLLIRAELRTHSPQIAAPSRWMTPPDAARLTGIPVKTIYRGIDVGRIVPRLKNKDLHPKQKKYSVDVDEVVAYAERSIPRPSAIEAQAHLSELAQQILADRSAKRPR